MGTIAVSLPSDGETIDVADYNTPVTTIVTEINGNLDNANIKTGAAIATSKLADDAGITTAKIADSNVTTAKLADSAVTGAKISTYKVELQSVTTNTTENSLKIQTGWNFVTGAGGNTVEKTITFPVGFTAIKTVNLGALGILNGSDPTAITQFNAGFGGNILMFHAYNITNTAMVVRATLDSSAVLASGLRVGFTWIAYGT